MKRMFERILRAIDSWLNHVPTDAWVNRVMLEAELAALRVKREQEPVRRATGLTREKVENFSSPGFITVDKTLSSKEVEALKHAWSIGWKK